MRKILLLLVVALSALSAKATSYTLFSDDTQSVTWKSLTWSTISDISDDAVVTVTITVTSESSRTGWGVGVLVPYGYYNSDKNYAFTCSNWSASGEANTYEFTGSAFKDYAYIDGTLYTDSDNNSGVTFNLYNGATLASVVVEEDAEISDTIWEGETVFDSSWGTIVTPTANKFASCAVGDKLVFSYKDTTSGQQIYAKDTSYAMLPGATVISCTAEEGTGEIYITNAMLAKLQSSGMYVQGVSFTLTSIVREASEVEDAESEYANSVWIGNVTKSAWSGFSLDSPTWSDATAGQILRVYFTDCSSTDPVQFCNSSWSAYELESTAGEGYTDYIISDDLLTGMASSIVIQTKAAVTLTHIDLVAPGVELSCSDYPTITYVSSQALDFSAVEGLTAYYAKSVGSETVIMAEVTGAVAAETPLYLVFDEANTSVTVDIASEGDDLSSSNLLVGSSSASKTLTSDSDNTYYVLQVLSGDDAPTFHKVGSSIGCLHTTHKGSKR